MNQSRCARCGAQFHCGVADARPCWCVAVGLDDATRTSLAERYVGCLCADCLSQAQAGNTPQPAAAETDSDPKRGR